MDTSEVIMLRDATGAQTEIRAELVIVGTANTKCETPTIRRRSLHEKDVHGLRQLGR